MWTFAVTRHADCIRLLAGRDMNICHKIWSLSTAMQPHTVYSRHKELLQSCYRKLKVNPTYGADLAHWTIIFFAGDTTWEVTNCTARRMQEPIFCHDNCKNLAKMRQVCQGAVGLCQKIVKLHWNYCASFYVVVTVIGITSMTHGTAPLEQSSLAFHCHICCFISWSAVKFPCGIIEVEIWNSTYVVQIVKCVFILKMVCFLFLRHNI